MPALLLMAVIQHGTAPFVSAQEPPVISLQLSAQTYQLTVGDPVPLTLSATYPPGYQVLLPNLPTQWGALEVLKQERPAISLNPDGTETVSQRIVVTAFAPGSAKSLSIDIQARDTGGRLTNHKTPPLELTVTPVLPDTGAVLRELKPQARFEFPIMWPLIIGGAIVAMAVSSGLFVLIGKIVRNRRRRVAPLEIRTPYETALDEVNDIERYNLPAQGQITEHYTLLATCIRHYLENAYQVPATELSTEEIIAKVADTAISTDNSVAIIDMLLETDVAKFSGQGIDEDTAHAFTTRVRDLIIKVTPPSVWSGREAVRSGSGSF